MGAHLGFEEPPRPEQLPELAERAAAAAAQARAAQPRVQRQVRARTELQHVRTRLAQVGVDIVTTRDEQAVLPQRLTDLRAGVADARAAQERLPALTQTETALRSRLEAHESAARLRVEVHTARQEWLEARETTLGLKEELLTLQQARIESMTAELTGALASGCSCPVHGSGVHPARAAAAPGAPDARAEKAARTRSDDASVVEHAFDAKVRELEAGLAAATARTGDTPVAELTHELTAVREQLTSTTGLATALDRLLGDLAASEREHERLAHLQADLGALEARLLAEQDALGLEAASLQEEVDALLDGTPHHDLAQLAAHSERSEALCRAATTRQEQADSAVRHHLDAVRAAEAAAVDAGFDDLRQACELALPPTTVEQLADTVDDHRRRIAAVLEILAEPGADDDAPGPPPPVQLLESEHAAALARRDEAAAALHVATARQERIAGLVVDLAHVTAPWTRLREDLELTTRLASFVEGKSADNQLKMRLSAYVLAYRLTQVVAAANERLARMSDQRYSLEHTGQRGTGETRGGLSLLVRDDWSGETRDPATLSGGETFVVSLALALGLADVVTHESGGAALDTLFVDEGFGSLDADTLDDVMDTLDSLRDGGRVVGLVSHVAEMRDRIPTQLVVTKARGGSSVRLRGC
ncbi:hypothetical protein BH09ACT12_BH09ACT12_09790 [soil metagenome]